MTDVTNPRKAAPDSVAARLIEQARAEGVSLVGPGSPLAQLTKQVLETALEAELDEHLGYEGPSPRILDTVLVDYAAVGSVAARRAS